MLTEFEGLCIKATLRLDERKAELRPIDDQQYNVGDAPGWEELDGTINGGLSGSMLWLAGVLVICYVSEDARFQYTATFAKGALDLPVCVGWVKQELK